LPSSIKKRRSHFRVTIISAYPFLFPKENGKNADFYEEPFSFLECSYIATTQENNK